jgi:hypothetical protein
MVACISHSPSRSHKVHTSKVLAPSPCQADRSGPSTVSGTMSVRHSIGSLAGGGIAKIVGRGEGVGRSGLGRRWWMRSLRMMRKRKVFFVVDVAASNLHAPMPGTHRRRGCSPSSRASNLLAGSLYSQSRNRADFPRAHIPRPTIGAEAVRSRLEAGLLPVLEGQSEGPL